MILLIYIIKTVFISGLLFGYYWLFLRNRFFHRFNRLFLLSIPPLSFLIPVLRFSLPDYWLPSTTESPIRLLGVGRGTIEDAFTIYATQKSGTFISWEFILLLFTLCIYSILLIRFFKTLRFLYKLPKNKPFLKLPEATLYFVSEKGTPFSFFKSIFWGNEMDLNTKEGNQILRHELFHVKQNHSLDILSIEIVSILLWFNPFIYLIRRELIAIHEYGADDYASSGTDRYEYASLILMKVSGSPAPLTHSFFNNQIKRRITMMTKNNKSKKSLTGRLLILPMLAVLVCLFSFKFQNHFSARNTKTVRVIIDPGHGGVFLGIQANGTYEKDINLSISRKIQSLARDYNIEVILTRDKDIDAAGDNLKESLNYRSGLAQKTNADLFISIHTNGMKHQTGAPANQQENSGFSIFIPNNSNKKFSESVKLASVISEYIKPDFTIDQELKQRSEQIHVLDKATVPAILIECGYLDNLSDLKYLQDEKTQEKIARDILEGIRKYSLQNIKYASQIINLNNSLSPVDTNTPASWDTNQIGKKDTGYEKTFTKVEVPASYPGGQNAWYQYLVKNLKYPPDAISKEVQGTVMVKFIVRKDSSLTDIQAISGPELLRAVSVKTITESGKWIPAKQNGYLVDAYCEQPINFSLEKKSN